MYSQNFSSGPGARLFLHQSNDSVDWVEELIWTQENENWSYGAQINGPTTVSHLSAVIGSDNQTLSLFYSTPQNAVQELRSDITVPNATYHPGVTIPNLLLNPQAAFSALSAGNDTYLYYSTTLSPGSNVTIREAVAPLLVNTTVSGLNSTVVAEPALQASDTGGKNASIFVPVSAVVSPGNDAITVFYPESVEDPRSGYGGIKSVWRKIKDGWGNPSYGQAQNMASVDLGNTV